MLLFHHSGLSRVLPLMGGMRHSLTMGNENRDERQCIIGMSSSVPSPPPLCFVLWFIPAYNGGCIYLLENCVGDILGIH